MMEGRTKAIALKEENQGRFAQLWAMIKDMFAVNEAEDDLDLWDDAWDDRWDDWETEVL